MAELTAQSQHPNSVDRATGVQFFDLSHPWGHNAPLWPYFPDVKIERMHYHAKSGVLSQQITTFMHCTTHTDAPAHVVEGAFFTDEVPLSSYFGTGVVVSVPKQQWEVITAADFENATPKIREGDIVIVNTGWHRYYGDNRKYFVESPGTYKEAGEWMRDMKIKAFGIDCQALDHPLGTAIGLQPNGPLIGGIAEEYARWSGGRDVTEDFPEWEPCHRALLSNGIIGFENVGGQIDAVTGKRCTFAAFPWRWEKGDGCIVRLVAMLDPSGAFRMDSGAELMQVTRIGDAPAYEAPNHFDMRGVRLQGWDVTDSQAFWVGLSHFLPGGGVHKDATPLEKVYVLLEGELTLRTDDGEATLGPLDSCHLAVNEARSIENHGTTTAVLLVIMPYPDVVR